MATAATAIQNTELWEGGFSNNPSDNGGETYRGISRNNWPTWAGWSIIDSLGGQNLNENSDLQALVVQFYIANFWQYDGINNQTIANKIFDLTVNVGKVHGVKIVQSAVGTKQDGIYGQNTEDALNTTSSGSLLIAIRCAAEQYHKSIVMSNPQDAQFLAGWLRRDES